MKYLKPTGRKILLAIMSLQGNVICLCQDESHGGNGQYCGAHLPQGGMYCTPCANNH